MEPNAEQRRPYHVYGRWKIGTGPAAILSLRRIEYLYMLFVHGMLDSDMIHALVSLALPPKPDEKPLKYRVVADDLRLMRDRPNLHVRVPDAFIDEKDTNANMIYEITPRGVEALLDAGRISFDDFQFWTKYQANYKERHFAHDVATAFISASLDLGARAIGGRWIPAWEMISIRNVRPTRGQARVPSPSRTRSRESGTWWYPTRSGSWIPHQPSISP